MYFAVFFYSIVFLLPFRFDANPAIINSNASLDDGLEMSNPHGEIRQRGGSQEQVLSVSGKKKCSHCDEELG